MKPFTNLTGELFSWLATFEAVGAFCIKVSIWNTITKEVVEDIKLTLPKYAAG